MGRMLRICRADVLDSGVDDYPELILTKGCDDRAWHVVSESVEDQENIVITLKKGGMCFPHNKLQ